MTNPLSRVAMQSILRERNPRINLTKQNEAVNLNKDRKINLNTKKEIKLEEHVERNFSKNEDCILKGIIRGETEVIESSSKNAPISLEEAANKIKKNR